WTLDHVGPLARSVEDAALLLGVLAGHDPADPTSARVPVPDYAAQLGRSLRGIRIGVPRDFACTIVDSEVGRAFEAALGELRQGGATVGDVTVPSLGHAGAALGALILAEARSALAPVLAARWERVSVELRVYLELAKLVTAEQYLAAQRLRTR